MTREAYLETLLRSIVACDDDAEMFSENVIHGECTTHTSERLKLLLSEIRETLIFSPTENRK